MKIDWQNKLCSRKLWALLASLVISVLLIFGAGEAEKVSGAIVALGGVVSYILGEAKIDAAGINKEDND